MDLDKASLCEVPEALMYILRYLPLDNSNGDDSEDRDDGKSGAVSHKYFWLSICLCHCPFFFSMCLFICLLSFCLCVCLSLSLSLLPCLSPSLCLIICLSFSLSFCLSLPRTRN